MEAGWLVGGSPEARRLAAGLGSVGSLDDLRARLGCASELGGSAQLEPPRNGLTGHVTKGVMNY